MATARQRLGAGARRRRHALVVVAGVAALVAGERIGWGLGDRGDRTRYDGRAALVVRVIDGDTLDVAIPDGDHDVTRVRLRGIDAPEVARPWEPADAGEPGGEAARDALRAWAERRVVVLAVPGSPTRDAFGRLLATVHDANGVCLNDQMVRQGLAEQEE